MTVKSYGDGAGGRTHKDSQVQIEEHYQLGLLNLKTEFSILPTNYTKVFTVIHLLDFPVPNSFLKTNWMLH